MALKIEKVFTSVFGSSPVRRKDETAAAVSEKSDNEQNQSQNQQFSDQKEAKKEDVEKAVQEMKDNPNFSGSGMRAEVIQTAHGLKVSLSQANGNLIKVMTAEEFLKLKLMSDGSQNRGKILDQKF